MAASVEKLRRAEQMARDMGERDALELKAALETEKQAAEKEKEVSEINVFTLDPNGFKTHWKIVSGTSGEDLNQMMKNQGVLSKWLKEHEYKPDEMNRGGGGPSVAPVPAGPVCGDCGGPMEHKTGKGKNGKTWAGYFCIRTKDEPREKQHAPVWE